MKDWLLTAAGLAAAFAGVRTLGNDNLAGYASVGAFILIVSAMLTRKGDRDAD